MRFKPGDRVSVIGSTYRGTVDRVTDGIYGVYVEWDDGRYYPINEDRIASISKDALNPNLDPLDPDCPLDALLIEHDRRWKAGTGIDVALWSEWVEEHYWPARDALRELLFPGLYKPEE